MQHKTRGSCHKGGRRFSKLNSKPLKVCPDALDVITSRPVLGLMINCPLYIDVCYIFFRYSILAQLWKNSRAIIHSAVCRRCNRSKGFTCNHQQKQSHAEHLNDVRIQFIALLERFHRRLKHHLPFYRLGEKEPLQAHDARVMG